MAHVLQMQNRARSGGQHRHAAGDARFETDPVYAFERSVSKLESSINNTIDK